MSWWEWGLAACVMWCLLSGILALIIGPALRKLSE